jgi:hypothetical protein
MIPTQKFAKRIICNNVVVSKVIWKQKKSTQLESYWVLPTGHKYQRLIFDIDMWLTKKHVNSKEKNSKAEVVTVPMWLFPDTTRLMETVF